MLNATKIAKPPIVGIGILLTRLALGLSTAPILTANLRTNGVKRKDKTIVTNKDATILYIRRPLSFSNHPKKSLKL
ncbi:hypothetical protein FD50_GL002190 [Liquorilactobacillus satsumensis DSM 16230 = JCM 12392]|uniref:Uncharacterized protein n=1 Tax=Liquorilactobacillus satsumensis DSM 16230 = JCM 12392 TaxID=1423801 RepID=A0A0R1V3Y1_9LACO|nr:hypothetical protein FD50_GL002190 [Liquorilactobacillus satsumensis DSM 16230 = JCM 12392]